MHKILSLLVLFVFSVSFAQETDMPKGDLSSPRNAIFLFYSNSTNTEDREPDYAKAARIMHGLRGEEAIEKVKKLRKIIDGKGLKIVYKNIPDAKNYRDTLLDIERSNRYVLFPNRLPEVYLQQIGSKWLISDKTIAQIDEIYSDVFPYDNIEIKRFIPEWGHFKLTKLLQVWQVLGFIITLILAYILGFLVRWIVIGVMSKIEKYLVNYTTDRIHKTIIKVSKPITFIIIIFLIERTLPVLDLDVSVSSFLFTGFDFANIVFWISVLMTFISLSVEFYTEYASTTHSQLDDQLAPVISNVLKIIVIIFGILQVLTVIGVNPTSVLAGASIGGLAVALSAQDTVKNLLGSFMIFLDKPFHIGDWIEAGTVTGTVEEVGFRSSRIRAADTSVFYIPNNQLAELVINNKGARSYRRYTTQVGIRYDTPPELMQTFIEGVRQIIIKHPNIRNDAYNVEFTNFGDSSLDILINVYFIALDWNSEQSSKHILHMAILKLANQMGVSFAFPSSTLMVEQFPEKTSFDMQYDLDPDRLSSIVDDILKDMSKGHNR